MKLTFTLAICLLAFITYGQEVQRQSWADSLDKKIEEFAIENGPGGVVAIAKGNQILYTKSFGYADIKKGKLNTSNTLFDIASCSKQFTAASILLLADQGKIDLQKPLQYYFPEFKVKTPIPVYSLLTHSSGISDYSEMLLLARGREGESSFTKKEILETIFKQTELSFQPTEGENYSNSNFAILSILVERVTNQSFPDYVRENIFTPMNMDSDKIHFMNDEMASNDNIAIGYPSRHKGQEEFIPELVESSRDKEKLYGAGGIQANIYSLVKWMSNYNKAKLKNGALLIDLLLQKDTLTDGNLTQFARGLESGTTKSGYKWVQHTGRSNSTSIMLWFPDYDISIVALMNTQEIWAQSITNKFFKKVLESMPLKKSNKEQPTKEEPKNKDISKPQTSIVSQPKIDLSVNDLKKFVGTYPSKAPVGSHVNPSGGVGIDRIIYEENKLQYINYNGYVINIKPISSTILELTGLDRPVQLRFKELNNNKQGFTVVDPSVNDGEPSKDIVSRIPEKNTSELTKFIGTYSAPTLINSIPIEILSENGKLFMQWGILKKRSPLYYLNDTILTSWSNGTNAGMQCNLVFKKNANGDITGFAYEGHRVWNLYFVKS